MATKGKRDNKTGSIYKDGDGYRVAVLVAYDSVTGKPKYRKARAASHAEAVEALGKMQHELRGGKLSTASGVTVGEYLTHWLETKIKPMRAPKTYAQYEWTVRDHILPNLGKKKLDRLNRAEVQALIGTKSFQTTKPRAAAPTAPNTKRLSRSTLYRIRAVLHTAYQNAIKDGLAMKNPCDHVELPPESNKAPVFLNPAQAVKLIETAQTSEMPELLTFMLTTGARIGEATAIRWQDLDLIAGQVRITGQLQRVESKLERRETTKTNQTRILPLGKSLVAALQNLRMRQAIDGTEDPDNIVFLNVYGRRLDTKYVAIKLKTICRKAGIPEVSPHKLRHTAATLALAETGDLHAVQKMLGHQQVALTSNLYGHATAETLRPLSNAMERILNQSE